MKRFIGPYLLVGLSVATARLFRSDRSDQQQTREEKRGFLMGEFLATFFLWPLVLIATLYTGETRE